MDAVELAEAQRTLICDFICRGATPPSRGSCLPKQAMVLIDGLLRASTYFTSKYPDGHLDTFYSLKAWDYRVGFD